MALPHRYPFRFIDRVGSDSARVELTAHEFWLRDHGSFPASLCAEVMAQAAALLLEEPGAPPRERWLAGIDDLRLERPLEPGESLEVRVRPEAKFGGVVRVSGEIWSRAAKVCTATLLLA